MSLIFILAVATLFYIGAWSKQAKTCFWIGFILIFLFTMFRGIEMGGTDAIIYNNFFKEIVPRLGDMDLKFWNYSNVYNFGWGYTTLSSIAKTIWDNYFSFQILYTIVCFGLLLIILYKLELSYKQKCMFVFVYFCYMFFWYFWGLLRQNISNLLIWIVIVDWKKERERKWLYYLRDYMIMYVAYLFHSTAIICFVLYPIFILLQYMDDRKKAIVTIGISCVMFLFGQRLIPVILKYMVMLAGQRYEMYLDYAGGGSNIINFALRIGIVLFIFLKGNNLKKKENLFNASIIACIMGSLNISLAVRALEYFAIGNYGVIGFCGELFHGKSQKAVFMVVYLLFITILIRYLVVNGTYILNYSFFDWKEW